MDTGFGKIPFTADLLGHVQTFDCGNEVYQIEVSDWIKNVGPYAVIGCMKRWGTKVWLYTTGEGDLIGFGSVGSTNWNWPSASDGKVAVALIPSLGVDKRFWHKPEGPSEHRYSTRIVLDLVAEARKLPSIKPVIGLFVHPSNLAAIQLYSRVGFVDFHQRSKGADRSTDYIGMIASLADTVPKTAYGHAGSVRFFS